MGMGRYYSSSDTVQWLRNKVFKIEKPVALGWGEWDTWDETLKKEKPVGYFFTETLPDWLEWFPRHSVDYVNNFRYNIANRIQGSHRLNSTLEKGRYHEISERMLYSMFDTFVDFIEIETAGQSIAFKDPKDCVKYNVPWWRRYWFFRWGQAFRCAQAGIDHLKWEMTLDQPNPDDPNWMPSEFQAAAAREKMALYTWWKMIRPQRGDPWVASGFRAFWDEMDAKYGEDFGTKKGKDGKKRGGWLGLGGKQVMTNAERIRYDKMSKANDDLEQQWKDEDTLMLTRLIKIRESLWT